MLTSNKISASSQILLVFTTSIAGGLIAMLIFACLANAGISLKYSMPLSVSIAVFMVHIGRVYWEEGREKINIQTYVKGFLYGLGAASGAVIASLIVGWG